MTDDELLPCPFCGREPRVHIAEVPFSGKMNYHVDYRCECGIFREHKAWIDDRDEAIAAAAEVWNARYERTCTMSTAKNALGDIGKKCSACERMNFPPNGKPYPYCPWCGAKVVDE